MDIFDVAVLNRVVEQLEQPQSFLLDRFFPNVQTEPNSLEIHFDVDESKPQIAPFVSPLVAGKIMKNDGFTTKSFRPAYVKDKRRFDGQGPLRRRAGERIGGSMTPAQRQAAHIALTQARQLQALTLREVVMATEILTTGKVTISGEKYPTRVVDFGRDPGHTLVLGAAVEWGDAGVSPLDNLDSWLGTIQTNSGASGTTVVMDPLAWGLFRKDAEVKELLDNRRIELTRNGTPLQVGMLGNRKQGRNVGAVGDLDFWVYQDTYVDENGATQKMLPDYSVIIGSPEDLEGTRCYGMIQDEEANWEAERYFSKSWLEKDPAIRYILLQSAPLLVPYRPDATMYVKVKS